MLLETGKGKEKVMKKSLVVLAFGTLGLGIAEFGMMSILSAAAEGLGISIAKAGHLISAYALGVCFGAVALVFLSRGKPLKDVYKRQMYDMSRVNANGYFDTMDKEDRYKLKQKLNVQRTEDFRNGTYAAEAGLPDKLTGKEPQFVKDYYDYYKTPRGYHKRSKNSNTGWNMTSSLSFINMPILAYSDEIKSAVLMIHGENAHSRYFSEDAYKKLVGNNKELMIIPNANHTDLYDKTDIIPFDKITQFFRDNLK